MATKTRTSLEAFLAMEETKPYRELIDGEVVEKPMPNPEHSALVVRFIMVLSTYLQASREARVDTELRHLQRDEERLYLPDISVTLRSRFPVGQRTGPVGVVPDIAIEVLSPDDRTGRVLERIAFYQRAGATLTWIVDPDAETVTVYRPGEIPAVLRAPAVLDAAPVLASFELPLADLFAVLHEDEEPAAD